MTRSLLPSIFGNNKKHRPAFQSLHDEIERVFEDFRGTFTDLGDTFEFQKSGILTPKINVSESDDTIEISAELPGVNEDDIDISVTDNVLVIKAEKSQERDEKEKDYHVVERSHGSYTRSIPLGFDMDDGKVEAALNNGVLSILISKPATIAEKTKKIPIGKAA
ncbi:MAG: Hsp20/alpha crystallin family protein [Rhizobiaceae bacterium]|nr:Hsp20/alpha crystallin family protein [Rhizobiaceae bacterium]